MTQPLLFSQQRFTDPKALLVAEKSENSEIIVA